MVNGLSHDLSCDLDLVCVLLAPCREELEEVDAFFGDVKNFESKDFILNLLGNTKLTSNLFSFILI